MSAVQARQEEARRKRRKKKRSGSSLMSACFQGKIWSTERFVTHCEKMKELVDSCAVINIDNGGWVTEYSVLFLCRWPGSEEFLPGRFNWIAVRVVRSTTRMHSLSRIYRIAIYWIVLLINVYIFEKFLIGWSRDSIYIPVKDRMYIVLIQLLPLSYRIVQKSTERKEKKRK